MEKVRPWCGRPSDRGRLKNRTEDLLTLPHTDADEGVCDGRVSVSPSVRPSVRLSHRSTTAAAAAGGFAAERGRLQQIPIYSCYACSPRSAANAGSVMLRAEGRGSTQTCLSHGHTRSTRLVIKTLTNTLCLTKRKLWSRSCCEKSQPFTQDTF